ncbi:MAG: glycosyl hydrolase family 28 protein, partial [Actinomycetota bacterium]|nr:glycosyl hydrolase family 28 protein [Actinomycetota bacterium]
MTEENVSTAPKKASKNKLIIFIIILLSIILIAIIISDVYLFNAMISKNKTKVVIYPAPSGIEGAPDISITVEGEPIFVYDTRVNFNRRFLRNPDLEKTPVAYFDFSGTVNVKIKADGKEIDSVTIRPLSLGIKPVIRGDTISFKLDRPALLTIEINDDVHRAIHLFANPLEENPLEPGVPGVHYFGPGVHNAGSISIKSNETIYIAGGAVVYGWIHCSSLENVRITGRGIIDGSIYDRWEDMIVPINLFKCKDVAIDGITILDPAAWTLNTYLCENIKINNVKIISARSNSDGITTQSCKNLTAQNCFVRSWDDSLVVKGYDENVKGITFDNIIIWTDLAQSC